ncbi:uncharacterized protein LOC144163947 [Haemaphysalis longicornis]
MVQERASPIVLQQLREPPSFRGSPRDDSEDWLEKVERVRIFNRWDDEETYRHIFFYLEDTARTWFENRESFLTNWTLFKSEFLKTFATVVRKERAALLLETRTQHPNEEVMIFVEEMKMLFRRADPKMTEEKQVRFLMRGVKQGLFAGLIRNPPRTVAEFLTEASLIERTLDMRSRQYDRQLNAFLANPVNAPGLVVEDLRETIRAVVREELRKLFPTTPQPQITSMTDVIREVQLTLGTSTPSETPRDKQAMNYSAAVRRPGPAPTRGQEAPSNRRPLSPARPPVARNEMPTKTDLWRTPDNRPLCYRCGEADHIYRRCPYKRLGLRGFSVDAPRPLPGQRPREIDEYLSETSLLRPRCNKQLDTSSFKKRDIGHVIVEHQCTIEA